MKKIVLALIATIMIAGAMMAQQVTTNQGYVMGYVVPTSTTPTTEYIKKNSFVMITADTTLYLCKINVGRGSRLSTTMLASAANYAIINRAIFGGKAITFFVDTANAQNIYGVKSFKNNATFAGTMGLTGNFAINTNKFNVTAASGNTTIAGTLGVTGVATFSAVPKTTIGTGGTQTGFGYLAANSLTTADYVTAVGVGALKSTTSGSGTTGIGYHALYANTEGVANTAIGSNSYAANLTGGYGTALGESALMANLSGSYNTAGGYASLTGNTTGTANTGYGATTLSNTNIGSYNCAFGYAAGVGNKSGGNNVYIGKNAGPAGTTSTASDKLYISNVVGGLDTALVYGDFNAKWLQINGALRIGKGITDTTITAAKGYMVFKSSDSTLYVCRSTTAAKKWYAVW